MRESSLDELPHPGIRQFTLGKFPHPGDGWFSISEPPHSRGRGKDGVNVITWRACSEVCQSKDQPALAQPQIPILKPKERLARAIGDHVTLANTEIENSIIMEGAHIDYDVRITESLIGRKVRILNHEHNVPKGHKLILGDQSTVTL